MSYKQEDDDGCILNEIQLNDSFIPGNMIGSLQQAEPKLQIRKPQDINQKSISASPEVQYEYTVVNTNSTHGKARKNRREIQRQDSSSSLVEVKFRGFATRYRRMKLVKASLRSSSDGMMAYMNINRDIMLRSWEKTLKPNVISGNSNDGICMDESWSPQTPEFTERLNENERLRHPSQSSSTVISPHIELSPSDNLRNPIPPVATSDPRWRSKNPDLIQSINSSSPLWNPDPPHSFSSPPSDLRIPLRIPEPPPPPLPPPPPSLPPSFRPPSPSYDPRSDLRNPDPPQSFRQPSPPYDPRSDLRNPDPPPSSFRQPSPPYNSWSELRNPDPPLDTFSQLSPRNPDRPHFNFQASYENRTCLTNPDPPQYISQSSLDKNAISNENRTSFTNPGPPQFNAEPSLEKNVYCEEPRITSNESITSMINNIRNNESTKDLSFRRMDSIDLGKDNTDKQCPTQQPMHTDNQICYNQEEQGNPESIIVNETIDLEIARRCPVYMKGLKCHKGEYCEKLHTLPREDKVPCMYFKGEGCRRTASDCWFWHPGEKVNEFVINDDAPTLVPSMGDTLGYIRKEQAANPDKYKTKIIPTNEKAPAKVVIPPAVGNANHTPLGRRQISSLDPHRSLLLPHIKNANSANIIENSSNQELSPPSTESNIDITSPSNDLISSHISESSSNEVSRIKLSRPAKVGAPPRKRVEIINNSSSLASFKIPKKNSVKSKSSSIIDDTATHNSKTLKTTKNIDVPNNQSSQRNMENNINTANKEIISNDVVKDNLIKSNVNDSKKIKSNRTNKPDQSIKMDGKEKENFKMSNETKSQIKKKTRIISDSEEESTEVNEAKEKGKEKKSKITNKKSNKAKRSRIESSEESDDDSSQNFISTNETLASSDEIMPDKGLKKSNMPSKKLKSDRDLYEKEPKENSRAIATKSKKSKSSKDKEEILCKQTTKHNKKEKELKKSVTESNEICEEVNSKSNNKLKSGTEGKEKNQIKKSKDSSKKIKKGRMSRIESSSESESEASKTSATNDANSDSNIILEQNAKNNNGTKITNIKVEKEENRKPVIIEEISLLSDSDEDCKDTVVKSESFLSEEVNEINTVGERKAMDDILWGIDKELENIEEASGGSWKRTPNHIEKDLYDVISQLQMEKFEDNRYPDIYNLDVNYRLLFLKLSNIDKDLQRHALLCKNRFKDCKLIPKDHEEDMSCCR